MSIQSFEKIPANEYRIFDLCYSTNQILEISSDGQRTLDGNRDYYFRKRFKFDENSQKYAIRDFKRFVNLGKEYNFDIDKVILVPTYSCGVSLSSMIAPKTMPRKYDFTRPNNPCNTLCIPFEGDNKPLPFGVFVNSCISLDFFVYTTLPHFLDSFLQQAFRRALKQRVKTGSR